MSQLQTSDPCVWVCVCFPGEGGSGEEESGSGCDSPSCETDEDMYFSTPQNPIKPKLDPVVRNPPSSGAASQGSMALALCGLALALALLAPHWR